MKDNETVVRRSFLDGPSDYLIVGLVTLGGLGMIGTWLIGQLAGLLFCWTWPQVPIGTGLSILGQLPRHLSDPRQAWPADTRSSLPGLFGFGVTALLVLTAIAAAATHLMRRKARSTSVRGFASAEQLDKTLTVKAALVAGESIRPSVKGTDFPVEDVGVRIGRARHTGQALAVSAEASVLLLAAPRTGKTSQVVIPWIHHWPGAAFVVSLRSDVLEATWGTRATDGRPVWVMAPTGMINWPTMVRWSPTSGCEDFDRARRRADIMVTVGKGEGAGDTGNGAFFGMTATNLVAGWLHAAALMDLAAMSDGKGPADYMLEWALDERNDQAVKILRDHPKAAMGTAGMMDALYRQPGETRSNLWSTALTALAPLLSPTVRKTFVPPGHANTLDFQEFIEKRGTLYLLISEQDARALAPLMTAFDDAFQEAFMKHAATFPGGRADPPVMKIIDEMANTLPNPHTPDLMSFSGGSGMFFVGVLQNRSQAEARFGPYGAAMLWKAATVKIAMAGLAGDELEDFSRLAGEYREMLTTYQYGSGGQHTVQSTLHDRRTMSVDAIRTLDKTKREALIIESSTPAVVVRMLRHYEGPDKEIYAASAAKARMMINGHGLELPESPETAATG
ncbi:type IV secretory system conjugative DNA transfer family protein [Actinomadura hibisca]|uniref:type IV secretory system conjugative DNA transfer family protein n=1 Tax=Actinomadura hibisca TaxID=68565 RepID=UPI00082F31E4|nr:TraM recognition domain-containing protein [Actinomadura hibisca]